MREPRNAFEQEQRELDERLAALANRLDAAPSVDALTQLRRSVRREALRLRRQGKWRLLTPWLSAAAALLLAVSLYQPVEQAPLVPDAALAAHPVRDPLAFLEDWSEASVETTERLTLLYSADGSGLEPGSWEPDSSEAETLFESFEQTLDTLDRAIGV